MPIIEMLLNISMMSNENIFLNDRRSIIFFSSDEEEETMGRRRRRESRRNGKPFQPNDFFSFLNFF